MANEVVVTRKDQTTIPASLRQRYGIREGTHLEVQDTGEGILLKPALSTLELAGSNSKHATPDDVKKRLDKLRAEDVD